MAEASVLEKNEVRTKTMQKHKVIMCNDDTTSFQCVIDILMKIFGKTEKEANLIALSIHKAGPNGKKVVAEYSSYSIAKMKAQKGMNYAKSEGYNEFTIIVK